MLGIAGGAAYASGWEPRSSAVQRKRSFERQLAEQGHGFEVNEYQLLASKHLQHSQSRYPMYQRSAFSNQ